MDIMELKKQPHLSASGIRDYCDCGLQYKFGRIDKRKPEFSSDSLDFGSVIHKVLAEYFQEKMIGNKLPLPELHKSFEDHWKIVAKEKPNIRYTKGRDFETVLQEGKNLLSAYYENVPDDNFKVLAIEEPFIFTIAGV
jgi:putative RecB family exonuclease